MLRALAGYILGGILNDSTQETLECETREVNDWLVVNLPANREDDDFDFESDTESVVDEDDILACLPMLMPFEEMDCTNAFLETQELDYSNELQYREELQYAKELQCPDENLCLEENQCTKKNQCLEKKHYLKENQSTEEHQNPEEVQYSSEIQYTDELQCSQELQYPEELQCPERPQRPIEIKFHGEIRHFKEYEPIWNIQHMMVTPPVILNKSVIPKPKISKTQAMKKEALRKSQERARKQQEKSEKASIRRLQELQRENHIYIHYSKYMNVDFVRSACLMIEQRAMMKAVRCKSDEQKFPRRKGRQERDYHQNDELTCTPLRTPTYINHRPIVTAAAKTDLLQQIKEIQPTQKAKEIVLKKHVKKSQLERQNKNYIYNTSAKTNRRKDLQRHHSGANNNRKC